ncbi:MAG: carbohydrate ABC transporter permease, partial [Anaerolineae bacterium]
GLLMAASVLISVPCMLLYFVAQRYFIQGIVFTGLKQ